MKFPRFGDSWFSQRSKSPWLDGWDLEANHPRISPWRLHEMMVKSPYYHETLPSHTRFHLHSRKAHHPSDFPIMVPLLSGKLTWVLEKYHFPLRNQQRNSGEIARNFAFRSPQGVRAAKRSSCRKRCCSQRDFARAFGGINAILFNTLHTIGIIRIMNLLGLFPTQLESIGSIMTLWGWVDMNTN